MKLFFLNSYLCFFWLLSFHQTAAQTSNSDDSVSRKKLSYNWKKVVIPPAILISTGLLTATDNGVLDKYDVRDARNRIAPHFHTHVDNYLQYSPIVAVYTLDALGIKGQHDVANQTALFIKTEIIMTALVFSLKKITAVPRPDTGELNSFPSGHTTQAFAAATFFHKEYGKDHPWYSVMAYTAATGVGLLRIMNNRHWVSDVLAGAGIGILSTNLVYLTHQNRWGKKSKHGIVCAPSFSAHTFMMCLVIPVKSKISN